MNNQALRRSFIAFHLMLGAVVLIESLMTVLHASGHGGTRHPLLAGFAGLEMIAALLFLWPATMRVGAAALLLIFGFAIVFHGLHGELPLALLVYAAGVVLVLVHGSAFGKAEAEQSAAS